MKKLASIIAAACATAVLFTAPSAFAGDVKLVKFDLTTCPNIRIDVEKNRKSGKFNLELINRLAACENHEQATDTARSAARFRPPTTKTGS